MALIILLGHYCYISIGIIRGLVMLPLLLHFLGIRLYGLWLGSGGILVWLSFLNLGIETLITQRVSRAYGRKDFKEVGLYYFSGMLILSFLVSLLVLLAIGISFYVPVMLKAVGKEVPLLRGCFQLSAVSLGISMLNRGSRGLGEALQRPLFFNISRVVCTIAGIGVTIIFLWTGFGLWAIPLGALSRSLPIFVIDSTYCLYLLRLFRCSFGFRRDILINFMRLSPYLVVGRIGGSLVSRIEPTLIAIAVSPEMATAFFVTRRVADFIRIYLDQITGSVYAGFSSLFAEGNRKKATEVYEQIISFCFSASLVGFGAYMAGNASFIKLWVGSHQFAGQTLTLLMATGLFFAVMENFMAYLLTATGDIAKPSLILGAECFFRLVLMAILLSWMGLIGLPLAMVLSCGMSCLIFYLWTTRHLSLSLFQSGKWIKPFLLAMAVMGLTGWLGNTGVWNKWIVFIPYMVGLTGLLTVIIFSSNQFARTFLFKKLQLLTDKQQQTN